jgi:hypothetical protein
MKNITVCVSDKAYREARVWAAEHDSSLSRIVQYLIETLPGIRRAELAFPMAKTASEQPETASSGTLSTEKTAI